MTTKTRPRSPKAPSRSLEKCFGDVRTMYDNFSHGSFSAAEAASALGVAADSGPTTRRIGSIREFGLLEGRGEDVTVSKKFLEMLGATPGDAVFKKNAVEAIKHSGVMKELLASFGTKLPSVELISKRLETQKRFNPEKAKKTAEVLHDSLKFAGVLDANNNILPIREDSPGPADDGSDEDEVKGQPPPGDPAPSQLRMQVPLADKRLATVDYPPDLSKEEAEKIGKVLAALVG